MNAEINTPNDPDRLLELGFIFPPFDRLEASNDPYIAEYLIGHEMFAVAWESSPSALFAHPGGGKTAMRIYTQRACWLSSEQKRKFPISYDLPLYSDIVNLTSLEAHEATLAAATATDLFLLFAYRPEIYLDLSFPCRIKLLDLLQQAIASDLKYNLAILEETTDPRNLSAHLDRTYILPDPPSPETIKEYCQQIKTDLEKVEPDPVAGPVLFKKLIASILNDLSFESVFILLDGVDGADAQARDTQAQYETIAPLLDNALEKSVGKVFLKTFLPLDLEILVSEHSQRFYENAKHEKITWDVPQLAEILRRRVYVASQGRFSSLDAISSPALRDVEMLIAKRTQRLPREAIIFARKVLELYLSSHNDRLEPDVIERADTDYKKSKVDR